MLKGVSIIFIILIYILSQNIEHLEVPQHPAELATTSIFCNSGITSIRELITSF